MWTCQKPPITFFPAEVPSHFRRHRLVQRSGGLVSRGGVDTGHFWFAGLSVWKILQQKGDSKIGQEQYGTIMYYHL